MLIELNYDAGGEVTPSLRSCFHGNSALVLAAKPSALLHTLLICNCLHACGFMDMEFTGYKCDFMQQGSRVMTSAGVDEDSEVKCSL